MTLPSTDRAAHWSRYLQDLEAYASLPQPLEAVGTLARVTGLVLEAAGVRVPVGAVCDVRSEGQDTDGRSGRVRRRPRLPHAHR